MSYNDNVTPESQLMASMVKKPYFHKFIDIETMIDDPCIYLKSIQSKLPQDIILLSAMDHWINGKSLMYKEKFYLFLPKVGISSEKKLYRISKENMNKNICFIHLATNEMVFCYCDLKIINKTDDQYVYISFEKADKIKLKS